MRTTSMRGSSSIAWKPASAGGRPSSRDRAAARSRLEPTTPWTWTPRRLSASTWTTPMNPVPTTAAPISVIGFTTCLILAETVRPIRLLQVGLGGWGRDWAWRVVPEVPEVEVVGYVDSDPQSLALPREEVPLAADIC